MADSQLSEMEWERIEPNKAGDWTQQRSERFLALRPLANVSSQPPADAPIFGMSTLGLLSARDVWVFQSSAVTLREQIEQTTDFFNEQVQGFTPPGGSSSARLAAARAYATRDDARFRWAASAEQRLARVQKIRIAEHGYRLASYRPFFRQRLYMDRALNHSVYQLPRVFPTGLEHVSGIVVANKVAGDSAGVLAVDTVPAYHFTGSEGRFFPRYLPAETATDSAQGELLPDDPTRELRDNINPEALAAYRARLGEDVTASQIFAWVYGALHAPEYRERYAADLSRLLPRIPDPADIDTFRAFSEAGQRLLDLHLGYEGAEPYRLDEIVAPGAPPAPELYRVTKMRWAGTPRQPDRSEIRVNDWITLAGIPDEAHDYIVGTRSALRG